MAAARAKRVAAVLRLTAGASVSRSAGVGCARGLPGSCAGAPASCCVRRPADQALERRVVVAGLSSLTEQTWVNGAEDRPAASVDHCDYDLGRTRTIEDDSVVATAAVGDRHELGMLGQGHVRSVLAAAGGRRTGSVSGPRRRPVFASHGTSTA